MQLEERRRWLALIVLCLGVLMIVLDTTIVNVALPSIKTDLHFTDASLVWVVNAYMLTFGGFLLLGGRLGDLYGHRRLFLAGIVLFTGAWNPGHRDTVIKVMRWGVRVQAYFTLLTDEYPPFTLD